MAHRGRPESEARQRLVWAVALVVFAVALGISLWPLRPSAPPLVSSIPGSPVRADFGNTVLYPAQAMIDGVNPYDWREDSEYRGGYPVDGPFLYSPHWVIVSLPFALIGDRTADKIFEIISIGCVIALVAVGLQAARGRVGVPGLLAISGLALVSQPVRLCQSLGQAVAVVGLGVVVALAYRTRNPALASVGVFFALVKPQFGVPIVIALLVLGAWRPVLWGIAAAAALGAIGLTLNVAAAGGLRPLADGIRAGLDSSNNEPGTTVDSTINGRFDVAAQLHRIFGWHISGLAQILLAILVLGLMALALRRAARFVERGDAVECFIWLVSMTGMLLAAFHTLPDTLVIFGAVALALQELTSGARVLAAPLQRAYLAWFVFVALLVRERLLRWTGWTPLFPESATHLIALGTIVFFAGACGVAMLDKRLSQRRAAGSLDS